MKQFYLYNLFYNLNIPIIKKIRVLVKIKFFWKANIKYVKIISKSNLKNTIYLLKKIKVFIWNINNKCFFFIISIIKKLVLIFKIIIMTFFEKVKF